MSLLGVPNFGVELAKHLDREQHRRTAVSDIEKHLHWLRDVSGRTNLEAAAAIEALVKERDLWKSDADRQRQLREDDRAEVERLKGVLREIKHLSQLRITERGNLPHQPISKWSPMSRRKS